MYSQERSQKQQIQGKLFGLNCNDRQFRRSPVLNHSISKSQKSFISSSITTLT